MLLVVNYRTLPAEDTGLKIRCDVVILKRRCSNPGCQVVQANEIW